VRLRYEHVVEKSLAKRRRARDQNDRLGRYPGAFHVEQYKADALVLGRAGVRAHQAENPIRLVRVRGPDLRAVDEELIALVLRAGLQRRQVGTRTGLGIALAPSNLASNNLRQLLALLFFGTIFEQRRSEHRDAEAGQRRAASERAHFLAQNFGLVAREAAAAVLARPLRHRPTLGRHAFEPQPLRVGLEIRMPAAPASVFLALHRASHLGRTIRLQPGARIFAESF